MLHGVPGSMVGIMWKLLDNMQDVMDDTVVLREPDPLFDLSSYLD